MSLQREIGSAPDFRRACRAARNDRHRFRFLAFLGLFQRLTLADLLAPILNRAMQSVVAILATIPKKHRSISERKFKNALLFQKLTAY